MCLAVAQHVALVCGSVPSMLSCADIRSCAYPHNVHFVWLV